MQLGNIHLGQTNNDDVLATEASTGFYTWNGHKNSAGFFGPLVNMGSDGTIIRNYDTQNYIGPLAVLSTGNILTTLGGTSPIIELSSADCSLVGTYVDQRADILAAGLSWFGMSRLRIDDSGNLYIFYSVSSTQIGVARWNSNKIFDHSWILQFTMNTTVNGSHDMAGACDISSDGRYVYSISGRTEDSSDIVTVGYSSNISIYKFDLQGSDSPVPTIIYQYPYFIYRANPDPPNTFSKGTYFNYVTPIFGKIAVSRDGTKIAIQRARNSLTHYDDQPETSGGYISYDNLDYSIDILSDNGELIYVHHLRDSFIVFTGGSPFVPVYKYCFFADSGPAVVEWSGDDVYSWLLVTESNNEIHTNLYRNSTMTKEDIWNNMNEAENVTVANKWTPYIAFPRNATNAGLARYNAKDEDATWGPAL